LAISYFDLDIVVLFILGIATGGLSNVTSGGAGVLTIYFLTAFLGLTVQTSTGTVLAASTVITAIGTISFYQKKQIDMKLGLVVGISGVFGAYIGGLLAASVQNVSFEHVFGIFCFALAAYTTFMFVSEWRRKKKESATVYATVPESSVPSSGVSSSSSTMSQGTNQVPSDSNPTPVQRGRLAGTDPLSLSVQISKGVLIGLATGLFGVALASMSIVLFILLFKLDTKMILGTSLFASVLRYAGGTASYLVTGYFSLNYFLVMAIAGAIGSVIGARMLLGGGKLSKDIYVKLVVIAILLFIGYSFLTKK
jgi:uncharacterized protein